MNMSVIPSSSAKNDEDNVSFSTTLLWKKYHRDAIFSLYSPFVLSVTAGNPPAGSFENYNDQDSYFMNAYYKAYKICTTYKGVDEKIREKVEKSAAKYNPKKIIPDGLPSATRNYIDFLINTAKGAVEELRKIAVMESKIPAFTMSAMIPCSRIYAFLGTTLKEAMANPIAKPYKDWIAKNASESTQNSARNLEGLVDGACMKMTQEERDAVENLYKHGMKLELEFFQSQVPTDQNTVIIPLLEKIKRDKGKLQITVDATAILAGDTYVTSPSYESLFQAQILKHAGDFSLNKKGGKLSQNLLQAAKKSMEDIKQKVVKSIGEVILQPYSLHFLEKVLNTSIYVIPSGDKKGKDVPANQLKTDDDKNFTAFIGCSIDNWYHLRNAKVGIVIGLNSDLEKKGREEGISFVPLFKGLVDVQSKYRAGSTSLSWKPNILYTISSWAEIDAFITGTFK